MEKMQRVAVLGSGNGGRAFCAQIASRGYAVTMFEPLEATDDYIRIKQEKEMYLEGDMEIGGRIANVTMDMGEAMEGAEIIFLVLPSFAHESMFSKMIPHLKDGQHVFIIPGNFGGLMLKRMMREMGVERKIFISETASLPYACRIRTYNRVRIFKKKFRMKLATSPKERNQDGLAIMNEIFQGYTSFFRSDSLLEMALDNANYTLHPLPTLLNIGAIEKSPASFRHYMDGITPAIATLMIEMDSERIALGKAYSLSLMPVLKQLKMYYGENDSKTFYDYVNSPESPYTDIVGHGVRSRYVTEDVPCLLVPALYLARVAGISTPALELVVRLASFVHGTDYENTGYTLKRIGLNGMPLDEIVAVAS